MSAITLVTGASGFIGMHLTRQLLDAGERVRVLCRRPELMGADIRGRVDVVRGDVLDPAVLQRACRGVHTVLHLAACARAWAPDPAEFAAVNRDAVAALIDVARAQNVQRMVHVSTVLTLCQADPRTRRPTPYEASKLAGEQLMEDSGFAVIVHPTRVYGPGPLNDANGATRLIAAYLNGRFRIRLDDGDVQGNYVHAADVATGIRLGALYGTPGDHFTLGGANASLRELLSLVSRISGVRHRVFAIPPRLGIAAAAVAELWGHAGGPAPITRDWVRVFLADQRVDIATTRRQLGYAPRSLETGITQTVRWLRATDRRTP